MRSVFGEFFEPVTTHYIGSSGNFFGDSRPFPHAVIAHSLDEHLVLVGVPLGLRLEARLELVHESFSTFSVCLSVDMFCDLSPISLAKNGHRSSQFFVEDRIPSPTSYVWLQRLVPTSKALPLRVTCAQIGGNLWPAALANQCDDFTQPLVVLSGELYWHKHRVEAGVATGKTGRNRTIHCNTNLLPIAASVLSH